MDHFKSSIISVFFIQILVSNNISELDCLALEAVEPHVLVNFFFIHSNDGITTTKAF